MALKKANPIVEGVRGDSPFREREVLLSLHGALKRPCLESWYDSKQPCSTEVNGQQSRWENGWDEDPRGPTRFWQRQTARGGDGAAA